MKLCIIKAVFLAAFTFFIERLSAVFHIYCSILRFIPLSLYTHLNYYLVWLIVGRGKQWLQVSPCFLRPEFLLAFTEVPPPSSG